MSYVGAQNSITRFWLYLGINLAQLQLDRVAMSGDGFHDDGAVIAVYEPVSGQVWWMYQRWTTPVELSDIKAYFLKEFYLGFDSTTAVGFAAAGPLLQV